jgi:transcription elongation factor Elf1
MVNFSRTCGPAGEFKRRIAENLSTIFFQGGAEWAKHDGDIIEVVTEDGTFEIEVSEAKYELMLECWKRGCGCEQAKNPKMKVLFITMAVIAVGGLGYDSFKALWGKIVGEKPPKHVMSKKGFRMVKVKYTRTHYCDLCGTAGTTYQCSGGSNYDMCKKCYDEQKVKVKAAWNKWLEAHPEEKKKSKKDDDDEKEEEAKSEAESEPKTETSADATDGAKEEDDDAGGEPSKAAEE